MEMKHQRLAKLTRPRLHRTIARERLFTIFDETHLHKPLMWVAGPPGAGKTTLVVSWLDARDVKGIWYQVDGGDIDLATFFYHLGQAAMPFSKKSQRRLPLFTAEYSRDVAGFSRRFFRNLFTRLPHSAALTFDNYQEGGADPQFNELLAAAVDEIPLGISLIVISRAEPPECFARLAANERIEKLNADDLKLTLREAESIAATRGVSPDAVEQIHTMTAGWAAGFILLLEEVRQGERVGGGTKTHSNNAVFDYFAGQLFDRATPEVQNTLLRLSYLPRMSSTVVRQFGGGVHSLSSLEDMHRRHLFVDRRQAAEPIYQFHALLQAFLQHRANETLTTVEKRDVMQEAARVLEVSGQAEDALTLYVKAGDIESARHLILREALRLIGQGRWKMVASWIEGMPSEVVRTDCWLMYWLGTATTETDPLAARERLQESFELARNVGDELCEAQVAAAIIETYMAEFIQFRPMDRWIAILERKFDKGLLFPSVEAELRVQSALLFAIGLRQSGNPGLPAQVERIFDLLRASADANRKVSAATHLIMYSSYTGPLDVGKRAIPVLESLLQEGEGTALRRAWGYAAMAWFHCLTRDQEACFAACDKVESIAHEEGLPFVSKLAIINRMWVFLFDFKATEGRALLERIERIADPVHPFDIASYNGARSWIAFFENDTDLAQEYGLKAVRMFDETGSMMHSVNFRVLLVMSCYKQGLFQAARNWIAEMRSITGAGITNWQRCSLLMWEANIALAEGNRIQMFEKLNIALTTAKREGGEFMFSNWLRPWMSRLCHEALGAGIEESYVGDLIRRYEFPPPSNDVIIWPWPIKIKTLGNFGILLDGSRLEFSHKVPRKPIMMLKVLIALGSNGVPIRKIIDLIWPNEDGDAAERAFEVAVHRLRKLLANPASIKVEDRLMSLNGAIVWTDVVAFDNISAELLKVEDHETAQTDYERALQLYRGPFLSGDVDASWAVSMRDRMGRRFVHLIAKMGRQLEADSKWDEAIQWYWRGLEIDDVSEQLYQGLMQCYLAQQRYSEGISVFQGMRRRLSTTLGALPSPQSISLLRELQSGAH
jgi:LuxR family transcriptional regulator, maltose regulon positive regulatory protein